MIDVLNPTNRWTGQLSMQMAVEQRHAWGLRLMRSDAAEAEVATCLRREDDVGAIGLESGSEVGEASAPTRGSRDGESGARRTDGDDLSPPLNHEHSSPFSLASSLGEQSCPRPPPSNLDKYRFNLPDGWDVKWSTKKGRPYYFHTSEPKKTIWRRPIGEPVGPEPAV